MIPIKIQEEQVNSDGTRGVWFYSEDRRPIKYIEYTTDGRLKMELEYDDNHNEAESRSYHPNGVPSHRSTYDQNGSINKSWVWSSNGQLLSVCDYRNNYKHGLELLYSKETGALISQVSYANDQFDGPTYKYYTEPGRETIKEMSSFSKGRAFGDFKKYFRNGKVEEIGSIGPKGKEGLHARYYESGKPKSIDWYLDGKLHGKLESYYENGKLQRRRHYKNGLRHGIEENFNELGGITSRQCYVDNAITEDFSLFTKDQSTPEVLETHSESGVLLERVTYQFGRANGPFEKTIPGQWRKVGVYKDDREEGELKKFDPDGKLLEVANYRQGQLHGKRIEYFSDGAAKREQEFFEDRIQSEKIYFENKKLAEEFVLETNGVARKKYYYDTGAIAADIEARGSYTQLIRHGRERLYSKSGSLLEENHFDSGRVHGLCRIYFPDGTLKTAVDCDHGKIRGLREYNEGGQLLRSAAFHGDGSIESEQKFDPAPQEAKKPGQGARIANYEIIRTIGSGGMGEVLLAKDVSLDRLVALKFLRKDVDQESRERILSEGQALARLQHPNVVTVYAVGAHEDLPYLAMEYIDGWSLHELIYRGFTGFKIKRQWLKQMTEGLAAAHLAGVIHRDLKPANAVVAKNGILKLIDFGISKVYAKRSADETQAGYVLGTTSYLAPEVKKGVPASTQSDIYSLGVVFYETLVGERPFADRKDLPEDLPDEDPRRRAPIGFAHGIADLIPAELKKLILWMTAFEVGERPDSMQAVLKALEAVSFDHLSEEFNRPENLGVQIGNADEAKAKLGVQGFDRVEQELILQMAGSIQSELNTDPETTKKIDVVEDLIVSGPALEQAIARYRKAKS